MTLSYDLYWSFRSPYSYLVTPRLVALERDHDVMADGPPGLSDRGAAAGFLRQ